MIKSGLLKQYLGKIQGCVRRDFPNSPNHIDDLIQEALIGFDDALDSVTDDKLSTCFTFCYQRAKWRCLDYLRKNKRHYREVTQGDYSPLQILESHNPENSIMVVDDLENALKKCNKKHQCLLMIEFFGVKDDGNINKFSDTSRRRIKNNYKLAFENIAD